MSWIDVYMFAQAILAGTLITSLLGARRRIKTQDIQLDCYEQRIERWKKRCEYLVTEVRTRRDTIKHLRECRAGWERENAGLRQELSELKARTR